MLSLSPPSPPVQGAPPPSSPAQATPPPSPPPVESKVSPQAEGEEEDKKEEEEKEESPREKGEESSPQDTEEKAADSDALDHPYDMLTRAQIDFEPYVLLLQVGVQ